MLKNKFQQLDFSRKEFFRGLLILKMFFVSQVQMSENLAGVYDGLEGVNGRLKGLKNETRVICKVLSNDYDRNAK